MTKQTDSVKIGHEDDSTEQRQEDEYVANVIEDLLEKNISVASLMALSTRLLVITGATLNAEFRNVGTNAIKGIFTQVLIEIEASNQQQELH